MPGEMLEVFAEKMLQACQALLLTIGELKRNAVLNDCSARNAAAARSSAALAAQADALRAAAAEAAAQAEVRTRLFCTGRVGLSLDGVGRWALSNERAEQSSGAGGRAGCATRPELAARPRCRRAAARAAPSRAQKQQAPAAGPADAAGGRRSAWSRETHAITGHALADALANTSAQYLTPIQFPRRIQE